MKKYKTLFYLLAMALMAVVFGEWFTMTNFENMPNKLIVHYLKYGFLFRIITFIALPVLLYNKEESLINRFYKRDKSTDTFTFRQKQWLIFSYIFISFFALFSINLMGISPLISLYLYIILIFLGLSFSFFTEKNANQKVQIQTDDTLIFNQYSINIKGKSHDGSKEKWLNIVNTFRGILGIAANGAGKTVSFVEPCIEQYAFKGYAGILFDFKFPTLSNIAHLHFGRKEVLSWQGKDFELIENPTKFYVINFTDITRSHRINPLNPKYIKNQIYAKEFAEAIINSLQKGQNYNDKFLPLPLLLY